MHGHEKSDPEIVAIRTNAGGIRREKPSNNAALAAAELVERRAGTKGNASRQSTLRAQDRAGVSQALDRIRQAARHNKKERFTALLHHINPETLRLAFNALKKDAAPGVDGTTWSDYEVDLERRLEELHDRVHRGAYRPQPSRRVYIPKADGQQRPLAVAAVEDKIVQGAVAMVLSAIYEVDFLGFSYGFRPGRGQHDALDALVVGISSRKVNWILDADIRSFFEMVDQKWMIRFVEHRIGEAVSQYGKPSIIQRAFHAAHLLLKVSRGRFIREGCLAVNVAQIAVAAHHVKRCRVQFADNKEAPFQAPRPLSDVFRQQTVMRLTIDVREICYNRRALGDDHVLVLEQRDLLPGAKGGELGRFGFTRPRLDRPALVRKVQFVQSPMWADGTAGAGAPENEPAISHAWTPDWINTVHGLLQLMLSRPDAAA
jgi:hypothetical protein